ncbi:MAG: ATP-binding protein, partial [Planctomycetota bacterium]
YVMAFIAWGATGCLGLLEGYGVLEQHPIFPLSNGTQLSVYHAFKSLNLLVLGGFLFTCAYLTCKIVSALRKREWHLAYLQTSMQAYRKGRAAVADLKRTALAGFASGINSEVKNPMGIIRARVDAMQYDLEDNGFGDSPIYQDLKVIAGKVNQVDATIDKVIAFLSHSPDSKESLNLRVLLHNLLEKMTPVFEDNRVYVKARIGSKLPEVRGSPRELNYLFLSLLQNAVDALQSSQGGRISIYARYMKGTVQGQGNVVIRIRDNGPGIPPSVQERIFDPFYSTRSKDRGMGLAIAYTIVRNHDGELRVRSRPPPGTSVTVILPRYQSVATADISRRQVPIKS